MPGVTKVFRMNPPLSEAGPGKAEADVAYARCSALSGIDSYSVTFQESWRHAVG